MREHLFPHAEITQLRRATLEAMQPDYDAEDLYHILQAALDPDVSTVAEAEELARVEYAALTGSKTEEPPA